MALFLDAFSCELGCFAATVGKGARHVLDNFMSYAKWDEKSAKQVVDLVVYVERHPRDGKIAVTEILELK
jgi:hypothetical protein